MMSSQNTVKFNTVKSKQSANLLRLTVAIALLGPATGCQMLKSGSSLAESRESRKQSLAQTPIAKKHSNSLATTLPGTGPSKTASHATAETSGRVQLASATTGPSVSGTERAGSDVVTANAMVAKDSKHAVAPAQYSTHVSGNATEVDSFSVPREVMPAMIPHQGYMHPLAAPQNQYTPIHAQPMGGYPPPNAYYGAPPTGPVPGSGPSAGGSCCPGCNHGGGVYKPVFPNFHGVSAGMGSCEHVTGECPPNAGGNYGYVPTAYIPPPRYADPQEHLFDGGDHEPLVRVRKDNTLTGLDPEDTVVQYQTMDGETFVESGCRVAIYAPRFASVRKRISTEQSDIAQRLRTTDRPDGPGMFIERLPSQDLSQPLKSQNKELVRVVESVRERQAPAPAESVLPMLLVGENIELFADLAILRTGDMNGTDIAKLAVAAANAKAWTQVEELNVIVDGAEATETSNTKRAQGVTLYEHKGARIRLCKVASEQMANPGDIVSFTIRVDNVGEQPLSNLVITDSLTPRLEFVVGSDKSSVAAEFTTTPNAVGSEVLRWELLDGLKPGQGGLVRFDCRVR